MKEKSTLVINVREERLKKSKKPQKEENKSVVDEVLLNAKSHFEEIFNRI